MSTTIKKQVDKQGICSIPYDRRIYVDNERFMQKVKKINLQIMNIDKGIGFGHCIPHETVDYVNTKYGDPIRSPPCPFSKRNLHPQDMLKDMNFYVELRDGMPHLKEEHSNGYYSQIQMAMGLSQLKFCDFIVYSFKVMIIIRISFSEIYFIKLTEKLNHFLKNFALP